MLKTASTFLQNVIAEISGFSTRELCVGHLRNGQDFSLTALADTAFMNIATHMHIRATDENVMTCPHELYHQGLCRMDDNLRGIRLRRNYGQDNAIMAGLRSVRGKFVVIMDDDLQHSPSDIMRAGLRRLLCGV